MVPFLSHHKRTVEMLLSGRCIVGQEVTVSGSHLVHQTIRSLAKTTHRSGLISAVFRAVCVSSLSACRMVLMTTTDAVCPIGKSSVTLVDPASSKTMTVKVTAECMK